MATSPITQRISEGPAITYQTWRTEHRELARQLRITLDVMRDSSTDKLVTALMQDIYIYDQSTVTTTETSEGP